jgi:hypothetical protein
MIKIEVEKTDGTRHPGMIEIFLTMEGLRDLMKWLGRLESQKMDHMHLFSEEWGGYDLTVDPESKTGIPIHQANIYIVDSWPQYQGQDKNSSNGEDAL